MSTLSHARATRRLPLPLVVETAAVAWPVAWPAEAQLAGWFSFRLEGLERGSRLEPGSRLSDVPVHPFRDHDAQIVDTDRTALGRVAARLRPA